MRVDGRCRARWMVVTDESVVVAVTVESAVQISARARTAYCWARPASSSLAMRCCASNPIAAFLSFLLALYFLSADLASVSCVVGALPVTHFSVSTFSAVRRSLGSMVRRPETSALASLLLAPAKSACALRCAFWAASYDLTALDMAASAAEEAFCDETLEALALAATAVVDGEEVETLKKELAEALDVVAEFKAAWEADRKVIALLSGKMTAEQAKSGVSPSEGFSANPVGSVLNWANQVVGVSAAAIKALA